MPPARVSGLCPAVPAHRPSAPARWWRTEGEFEGARLRTLTFVDGADAPEVAALTGLCAPCSLPSEFMESIARGQERREGLHALRRMTRERLFSKVRAFAASRARGHRHPARSAEESLSSLDRRRLARFHCSLPLLCACPTLPWDRAATGPRLVEVDVPAALRALGLPSTGLSGSLPDAVARRASVVEALARGATGFGVDIRVGELALASSDALESLVACVVAAWVELASPDLPEGGDAWIPVPPRTPPAPA